MQACSGSAVPSRQQLAAAGSCAVRCRSLPPRLTPNYQPRPPQVVIDEGAGSEALRSALADWLPVKARPGARAARPTATAATVAPPARTDGLAATAFASPLPTRCGCDAPGPRLCRTTERWQALPPRRCRQRWTTCSAASGAARAAPSASPARRDRRVGGAWRRSGAPTQPMLLILELTPLWCRARWTSWKTTWTCWTSPRSGLWVAMAGRTMCVPTSGPGARGGLGRCEQAAKHGRAAVARLRSLLLPLRPHPHCCRLATPA